jgi:hypothetical protein
MEKIKNLADAKTALENRIKEGNKAIADGVPLTADFLAGFAAIEKEYAELKAQEVYRELMAKELPMKAAIVRYSYTVIRHNEVRDSETKMISELKLVEKDKQIDLLKFAKFGDLDMSWQHKVAVFNQSLCLRAAQELGYSNHDIKKLASTYYLQKQAQELLDGKTVTSNSALCRILQRTIDAILPPADEDKGNTYKCNGYDVKYLLMCYTKKGRNALSIAVSKDGFLRNLVMDIMHRIIEGKLYSIEYRTKKDTDMFVRNVAKEVEPSEEFDADDEVA